MLEKAKRKIKPDIQDRLQPTTVEELIRKYDLENKGVYDYLDKIADYINKLEEQVTKEKEVILSETLWENSDKSVAMGEEVIINLTSADYDYLEWFFIYSTAEANLENQQSISCLKGNSVTLFAIGYSTGVTVRRIIDYISDTQYKTRSTIRENGENNTYCIPVKAVGHKKLIKI